VTDLEEFERQNDLGRLLAAFPVAVRTDDYVIYFLAKTRRSPAP